MVNHLCSQVTRSIAFISIALSATAPAYAQNEVKPLTESTIIEVINSVNILTGEDLEARPAKAEMLFKAPDFLETGRRSRARLEAEDGTITRIGSNTLFSFDDSSRTINLKRGSLLFHSPEGRGGGRVVTASATASVIGTTIIVAATADGGFKLIVLEGVAEIAYPDGTFRRIGAGQMTFITPEDSGGQSQQPGTSSGGKAQPTGGKPGPVLNFDLSRMKDGSGLLNGFSAELPSAPKIELAINQQVELVSEGGLESTDTLVIGVQDGDVLTLEVDGKEIINSNQDAQPQPTPEPKPEPQPEPEPTLEERLESALAASVNLSQDGFAEDNLFGFPGVSLDLLEIDALDGEEFFGFFAREIVIEGGSLHISPIGISPTGANFSQFNMLAIDQMTLGGDVTFSGFGENAIINLLTAGSLDIAENTRITVDSDSPSLFSIGTLKGAALVGTEITNTNGALDIVSIQENLVLSGATIQVEGALPESASPFEGDTVNQLILESDSADLLITENSRVLSSGSLFLEGSNILISASTATATETFEAQSEGNIKIDAGSELSGRDIRFDAPESIQISESAIAASGLLSLNNFSSPSQNIAIEDSSLAARTAARIQSGGLVRIEASSIEAQFLEIEAETIRSRLSELAVDTLDARAFEEIELQDLDLRDLNSINMAARTLILSDVQFSSNSSIRLGSEMGRLAPSPNTGSQAISGYVNFVENVTLDGSPAENFVASEQGGLAETADAKISIFSTSDR